MEKFYIEKARDELREDETRKTQSLAQFRDWIEKHQFLSKIDYDEKHLLKFLRASKYNMDKTFSVFERWYLTSKIYPKFFDLSNEDFDRLDKLLRAGVCVPLRGRNKDGQKVLLTRYGLIDPDKFDTRDTFRLMVDVIQTLLEEEETQISGIVFLGDMDNLQMKQMVLPADLMEFIDFLKKGAASRQKSYYLVNLPSIANFLVDIFKSAQKEKLRERLVILKNPEDLKNFVDVEMLPKEYGGTVPIQEILDEFVEIHSKCKYSIKNIMHAGVEWEKVPVDKITSSEEESVGSFRTLRID